jgi:rod shape-determining protein MreC
MPFSLKKRKSIIVLLAIILFQFVLISIQVPRGEETNYLEKFLFALFSPLKQGTVSFFRGVGSLWRNYIGLHRAQRNNQRLEKELFYLQQENSLLRGMLETYKTEKEMRDLLSDLKRNILSARVIGIDASNPWRSLVINKGSLDGVKKNMVVLDKQGQLVGRVVDPITFKQARVQLITDTESGVYVRPEGKDAQGIVSGIGNGRCELEYILSTDVSVEVGDKLITVGTDGIYMPGILVGRVISVVKETSLFKKIEVEPAIKLQDLDQLAVISTDVEEVF